jgi:hypothetical protein
VFEYFLGLIIVDCLVSAFNKSIKVFGIFILSGLHHNSKYLLTVALYQSKTFLLFIFGTVQLSKCFIIAFTIGVVLAFSGRYFGKVLGLHTTLGLHQ